MKVKLEKIINNLSDISKGKKLVKRSEVFEGFKYLAENIKDIIFIQDMNFNIIYVNSSVEEIYGYKPEDLIGTNVKELFSDKSLKKAKKLFSKYSKEAKQNKDIEIPIMEYQYIHKNKSRYWGEIKVQFLYNSEDNPIASLGIVRDISKRKEREEKIKSLSFQDQLTGLYNRRFFTKEMERLNKSRKLPISIVMADIDGLKYINDNFGHQAGDKFIKKAAEILNNKIREADILARTGGDEFAVILPEVDLNTAQKLCRRIKNGCRRCQKKELPKKIKMSLGCATKTSREEDLKEIFNKADQRMYKDKVRP